ncbi:MAG: hypothetical protein E7004_03115 [Alphaproteobacteria bacterium]|nr:hypothetical protein [Alphaproteobacteria bacterium]
MEHKTVNNELKMLSAEEISKRGWKIPSISQFSKNMEDRLKKVRGEEDNSKSFLLRHNYKSNTNSCQA